MSAFEKRYCYTALAILWTARVVREVQEVRDEAVKRRQVGDSGTRVEKKSREGDYKSSKVVRS